MRIIPILLSILLLVSCSKMEAPLTAKIDDDKKAEITREETNRSAISKLESDMYARRSAPAAPSITPTPAPKKKAAPHVVPSIPPSAAYISPESNPADDIIDALQLASMAFSVPSSANVEERIKIQLLINPSSSPEALEAELSINGNKSSTKVLISKIVMAKLTAPGFVVQEITPAEQAISQKTSTEWIWILTPTAEGKFNVHLDISAVVKVDRMRAARHIKTFEKDVVITVTPIQQALTMFEKYGEWVWTSILVPVGMWIWARIKRRRKNTPK